MCLAWTLGMRGMGNGGTHDRELLRQLFVFLELFMMLQKIIACV